MAPSGRKNTAVPASMATDEQVDGEEQLVFETPTPPSLNPAPLPIPKNSSANAAGPITAGRKSIPHLTVAYLFCGDCGSPLFSRSRPQLAPQYVCGAYLRRGRKLAPPTKSGLTSWTSCSRVHSRVATILSNTGHPATVHPPQPFPRPSCQALPSSTPAGEDRPSCPPGSASW